jgi:hypothetical protein
LEGVIEQFFPIVSVFHVVYGLQEMSVPVPSLYTGWFLAHWFFRYSNPGPASLLRRFQRIQINPFVNGIVVLLGIRYSLSVTQFLTRGNQYNLPLNGNLCSVRIFLGTKAPESLGRASVFHRTFYLCHCDCP